MEPSPPCPPPGGGALAFGQGTRASAWWPDVCPWDLVGLSPKRRRTLPVVSLPAGGAKGAGCKDFMVAAEGRDLSQCNISQ